MSHLTLDPFSDDDPTFSMIKPLADGSVAGVVNFHLWRMQLMNLRALPETSDPAR